MQRICIMGCSGSGKSTFSRRLAEATGLPLIHLDRLFWRPGWRQPSTAEWQAQHQALIDRPSWIIDGSFSSTVKERIRRADAVIIMDRPRWLCFLRIAKRLVTSYGRARTDMAPDCPEKFDLVFLIYVWQFKFKHQPRLEAAIAQADPECRLVIARSERDLDAVLAEVRSMRVNERRLSHA